MNKFSTRQKRANHLAEQMRQRLTAGEFTRCPLCFVWVGLALVGSIGIYVPRGGGALQPYCLCQKCQSRLERKPDLVNRIEAYLRG